MCGGHRDQKRFYNPLELEAWVLGNELGLSETIHALKQQTISLDLIFISNYKSMEVRWVCVRIQVPTRRPEAFAPLKLDLEVVVSHPSAGNQTRSSLRAMNGSNC